MSSNSVETKEELDAALISAVEKLEPFEIMDCMARMLCSIAVQHGQPLDYKCDLGTVVVVPTQGQIVDAPKH